MVEYITKNNIVLTVIGPIKFRSVPAIPVIPAKNGIIAEAAKLPAI